MCIVSFMLACKYHCGLALLEYKRWYYGAGQWWASVCVSVCSCILWPLESVTALFLCVLMSNFLEYFATRLCLHTCYTNFERIRLFYDVEIWVFMTKWKSEFLESWSPLNKDLTPGKSIHIVKTPSDTMLLCFWGWSMVTLCSACSVSQLTLVSCRGQVWHISRMCNAMMRFLAWLCLIPSFPQAALSSLLEIHHVAIHAAKAETSTPMINVFSRWSGSASMHEVTM